MDVNTKEIITKSTEIITLITEAVITTEQEAEQVGALVAGVKIIKKDINATFKPILDAAEAAVKTTRAQRDNFLAPLDRAEVLGKTKLEKWDDLQKARLEEERKKAEEERLAREAEREKDKADGLDIFGEEELPDEPIIFTPRRVSGVSHQSRWSAEVFDIKALIEAVHSGKAPENVIIPDQTVLNGLARSLKDSLNIPGVRAVSKKSTSVRT